MISPAHLKRLSYVKYIYSKGKELLSYNAQLFNALSILSFHDAAEMFLQIAADKLGYKYPQDFMSYWLEAQKKGKTLPFQNEFSRLNRLRTSFKHHGILPTRSDCDECEKYLQDFFSTVSQDILETNFGQISLSDFIENRNIRKHIKAGEGYLEKGDFEKCIDEAAKGFAFITEVGEGDYSQEILLDYDRSELYKISPSLYRIRGLGDEVDRNFINIKNGLNINKKYLERLISEVNILLLGVDNYKFKRFNLLTPRAYLNGEKEVQLESSSSEYYCKYNMNHHNAIFCLDFVIDNHQTSRKHTRFNKSNFS